MDKFLTFTLGLCAGILAGLEVGLEANHLKVALFGWGAIIVAMIILIYDAIHNVKNKKSIKKGVNTVISYITELQGLIFGLIVAFVSVILILLVGIIYGVEEVVDISPFPLIIYAICFIWRVMLYE